MQITQKAEHGWSLGAFTDTIHRGGVALWAWSPELRLAKLDSLCREYWGVSEDTVSIDDLFERVHDDDRQAAVTGWLSSAVDPEPYSFDFRIGVGDRMRWISARGVGGSAGRSGDWVQAIFLDVTQRRRAEETAQLVSKEMAHRLTNMFAVARALTSIIARESTDVESFASDLSGRFEALHRATVMAMSTTVIASKSMTLLQFIQRMLLPYKRESAEDVIDIDGEILISAEDISNYAMIFHELATNSAKYGAFSGNGLLTITANVKNGNLRIRWREELQDGIIAPANGTGFGSKMLHQTVNHILRGTIDRQFETGVFDVLISVPVA